jgi:hypothetical protein
LGTKIAEFARLSQDFTDRDAVDGQLSASLMHGLAI